MKPRYRELNAVYKRRYTYHVAILNPTVYRASLSSLGLQIMYYMLNKYPEVYAERVVVDCRNDVLRSIETGTPISKFDLILATAYYELDYPAIARILIESGLGVSRLSREKTVIVGGPSPTANPEPLYCLADAVFRGEAEVFIDKLVDSLPSLSLGKRAFLEELSSHDGVWIPELKEQAEVSIVKELDKAYHPIAQIQSLDEEPIMGRALLVEPSRGCNRGCKFCMEASITRPRRERSFSMLKKIIREGLNVNNVSKVVFYSLSFFDSKLGDKLLELLVELGVQGSIPSVRADALNEYRIELVKKIGQKTIAIAPETASERLKNLIGKNISRENILDVARECKKNGLNIKLYYMVGLPGEELSDLEEIVKEVSSVKSIIGFRDKVRVSVNPFIPKPYTEMWCFEMKSLSWIKKAINYLKKRLKPYARVEVYSPKHAYLQYKINRLGKDAFNLIRDLALKTNVRPE